MIITTRQKWLIVGGVAVLAVVVGLWAAGAFEYWGMEAYKQRRLAEDDGAHEPRPPRPGVDGRHRHRRRPAPTTSSAMRPTPS